MHTRTLPTDEEVIARIEAEPLPDKLLDDVFGEVIHRYTRAEAIADGVLVELPRHLAQQASVRHPVAITAAAFHQTIGTADDLPAGQDVTGRTWDVLWMMYHAMRRADPGASAVPFVVHVYDGKRPIPVQLKATCGPGDAGEPVLTVMLVDED